MPAPKRLSWLLLLFGAFSVACQDAYGEAKTAYDEARYADAAVAFRAVVASELSPKERAHLELYSGLTDLALGDLRLALPKLNSARAWFEQHPEQLRPSDQGRLLSAWYAVGRMPGEALRP